MGGGGPFGSRGRARGAGAGGGGEGGAAGKRRRLAQLEAGPLRIALDDRRIGLATEQEVAIATDHADAHAVAGEPRERGGELLRGLVGAVVADPGLEEVAQKEELGDAIDGVVERREEPGSERGRVRAQVHVGCEQRAPRAVDPDRRVRLTRQPGPPLRSARAPGARPGRGPRCPSAPCGSGRPRPCPRSPCRRRCSRSRRGRDS